MTLAPFPPTLYLGNAPGLTYQVGLPLENNMVVEPDVCHQGPTYVIPPNIYAYGQPRIDHVAVGATLMQLSHSPRHPALCY